MQTNELKVSNTAPVVWKTEDGLEIRINHMSNEHLTNALTWLLTDNDGNFTDLNEVFADHLVGDWIIALNNELYRRIGAA